MAKKCITITVNMTLSHEIDLRFACVGRLQRAAPGSYCEVEEGGLWERRGKSSVHVAYVSVIWIHLYNTYRYVNHTH